MLRQVQRQRGALGILNGSSKPRSFERPGCLAAFEKLFCVLERVDSCACSDLHMSGFIEADHDSVNNMARSLYLAGLLRAGGSVNTAALC